MIAVKIKVRLQSMSNIMLACLAATDAMVGILVQPLYISLMIIILQGKLSDVCPLQNVLRYLTNFFCFSSFAHLVLMSLDRYIAIKQSYTYDHAFMVFIAISSVVVYCEARRHEKQIAAQQV